YTESCGCGSDTTVSIKSAPTPSPASCCSVGPAPAATQSGCDCGSPTETAKQKNQIKGTTNTDMNCGVWSLAYIAKSFGIKKDEKAIKKLISYDPNKGATMQELVLGAQKLGLEAKGYRMSYAELTKRKLPIIIYIPNHFMVLTAIDTRKNQPTFADTTKKKLEMTKAEFLNLWQGYVLEIKKKT
ncbi:MAG: cysteine peptidase family C39 domain-containing protein, partial [bacterium]|nr:cysteine peptidase family C39 domain-containing protein [bacterium]